MARKILKLVIGAVTVIAVALAGMAALTVYRYGKLYDPPFPAIERSTSQGARARGRKLFMGSCAPCHLADDGRAIGRTLDFPAFFGNVHAANITRDPIGGVGAWTDRELARMIRTEIGRDGKFRPMPAAGPYLGDDDVAALLTFLRSDDPMLAPVATPAPRSDLSLAGKVIFVWMLGIPIDTPTRIEIPPRGPTPEYGRYVAMVGECWQCHTPGFDKSKLEKPGLYGGGFEFRDADGRTLYSSNLTPHTTGLGGRRWTLEQFTAALRAGVTPDGRILRAPMPRFRYADDVEIAAVWAFLGTLAPVDRSNRAGTAAEARVSGTTDPQLLWSELGCVACHGEKGQYREKIQAAAGKSVDQVARWIRHPEAEKPGTQMPTFASVVDEDRALLLAVWVQKMAVARSRAPGRAIDTHE
jgi:mono/diheme cytochrome c family protein